MWRPLNSHDNDIITSLSTVEIRIYVRRMKMNKVINLKNLNISYISNEWLIMVLYMYVSYINKYITYKRIYSMSVYMSVYI